MLMALTSLLFSLVGKLCEPDPLCHLKTYSVPCNPSTYCSRIETFISVNEIENGESDFNVTLIAYDMDPSRSHGIMLTLAGQEKTLKYHCDKLVFGVTQAIVYADEKRIMTGSSIYMNGNLICTWIAHPLIFEQSPYDVGVLDLVHNANYSLALGLDEIDSIIAQNSTELPWYQLGFTKCGGYQIYGNDECLLIVKKKMNFVQFWINTFVKTPKFLRVSLSHESLSLDILCNYSDPLAYGYVLGFGRSGVFLTDDRPKFNKIIGSLCSVELPDTFLCNEGSCSIWDSTFDIQILKDNEPIYNLHNIKFNEPISGRRSSCGDIAIETSFVIAIILLISSLILYISYNLAKKWVSYDT